MKHRYTLLALGIFGWLGVQAQSPAGDAFVVDYDQFQNDNIVHWINAGNDASLMPSSALTMEAWIKVQSPAWNQKVMGKLNNGFNSGYLLGIDQGKIYPEIWAPSQSQLLDGFMPPTPEPYYWVHIAVTWEQGGDFTGYINGLQVGQVAASASGIASNSDDLIIGIAPWDLSNFQTFGKIDEVRFWSVARSAAEVKEGMFRNLTGSETGLELYYTFDGASGTNVSDLTANGNDGIVNNANGNDFTTSEAVLGNADAQGMMELEGLWNALGFSDPRFVTTANGLSVTASNIADDDYLVFGHDGGSGTSTSDLPSSAPGDFERTARMWYVDEVGLSTANLILDLNNGAGGGATLDLTQPAANYTLLYRATNSGAFSGLAVATNYAAGIATFENVGLADGYYAVGVGSSATPVSIGEENANLNTHLNVYPNPNQGTFTVSFVPQSNQFGVEILDLTGRTIATRSHDDGFDGTARFNLNEQGAGIYLVRVTDGANRIVKRVEMVR